MPWREKREATLADTDSAFATGLTQDSCHAPHWGYFISGTVQVDYADGELIARDPSADRVARAARSADSRAVLPVFRRNRNAR
jgi:hypothetical protein